MWRHGRHVPTRPIPNVEIANIRSLFYSLYESSFQDSKQRDLLGKIFRPILQYFSRARMPFRLKVNIQEVAQRLPLPLIPRLIQPKRFSDLKPGLKDAPDELPVVMASIALTKVSRDAEPVVA